MLTGLHDPTSSVSPFELALFALVSYGVFFGHLMNDPYLSTSDVCCTSRLNFLRILTSSFNFNQL